MSVLLARDYQLRDALPGYEEDAQPTSPDQTGSISEQVASLFLGESGALDGLLFDSYAHETIAGSVATPLEDAPEPETPGIDVELANRLSNAGEVVSTHVYQPQPLQAPGAAPSSSGPIVAPRSAGSWGFLDTLRNEAAKALEGLRSFATGGQGA